MEILNLNSLEEAITALFGEKKRIVSRMPISGGDINEAYRLSLSDGATVFMKCNATKNLSFFEAEAKGLATLRETNVIGVPKAMAIGTDKAQGMSFILMECVESAIQIKRYWEVFGKQLAKLHKAECARFVSSDANLKFGFETDNYIGASPQKNTPTDSWITFFRECRLLPQIEMAQGYLNSKMHQQCIKLLDNLDSYLVEPDFPSLLHGDLWSGNIVCGPTGKAWIIDPAVYVGHFEAELAMTELFGGFSADFYGAYAEINHIDKNYKDRKDLYNLYHMLNHLNLFGGSYLNAVQKILNRYA